MGTEDEEKKERFICNRWFGETPDGPGLIGSKCKTCGKVYFPKKTVCQACWEKDNMETVPLSRKGKLVAYATDDRDLMGVGYPHICGFVDFPEGIRLFSMLSGVGTLEDEAKLKKGMEMETVVERYRTDKYGKDVFIFKFKPCFLEE